MIDIKTKTTDELKQLAQNYERAGKTQYDTYVDVKAELQSRRSGDLSIDRTVEFIREAARKSQFVSYGSIVRDQGQIWTQKVRSEISRHLDDVCRHSHERGWPLLASIVVNQQDLKSGKLDGQQLDGFLKIAGDLGYSIDRPLPFLRDQQQRVFDWAVRET